MTKSILGLILALVMTSCASVSVDEGVAHKTRQMPRIVYVTAFGAPSGSFEVDREGADLTEFKENLQLMLKTAIATDLTDRLIRARPGTTLAETKLENAWLVEGEFTRVKQGSRLLRSVIGFGAGGTKLETRVRVYDLAHPTGRPFLTFTTTGGSNAEPGAILSFTTDPLEIAIGGVSGVAHGLSEDTKRTAREITAELSDYMYRSGWISEDKWIEPKRDVGGDIW